MKQKKKILSAYKRKIHIKGEEWTYQIRSSISKGFIKVCSPDRKNKWSLEVGELSDSSSGYWWDYESDYQFVNNDMTPFHVKRLIEKRILGRKIPR